MNANDAKNLLASFLVGHRVSRNDLEQASNLLAGDEPYRRFLSETMGIRRSWVSECHVFLSRVAELAELSSDEQLQRFPVLAAHCGTCQSCREVYWNIKPMWYDVRRSTEPKDLVLHRRLTDCVDLAIDKIGRVLERAIGVPPVRFDLVAATAASPIVGPQIREWELRDDDAGYLIRLTFSVVEPGATSLTGLLENSPPDASKPPPDARIEIRHQERNVLVVSGRLADFETEPITLVGAGGWTVRIERSDIRGNYIWEVPVQIVQSEPDHPINSGEGSRGALMGGEAQNDSVGEAGDLRTGQMLADRYCIERELGRGGMGVVYIARDRQLLSADSTRVVIKVLRPEALQDAWFKKKFFQEFESLTRVNHPNVVRVLGSGTLPDKAPFFVMEYVEGKTLASVMTQEGLDFERAAHLMRQIGQALSAVHEKGILHCDLKPDNIMLQTFDYADESIKLIDFGVAKIRDSRVAFQGGSTKIAGTIHYASPEHFTGKLLPESDVYSFAVIAYEILTGRRPFNASNEGQHCYLQLEGVKIRPSDLRPNLPPAAEEVILKGLVNDPNERYRRASEFGENLARALTSSSGSSTLVGAPAISKRHIDPASSTKRELTLEIGHVLVIELSDHPSLPIEQQVQQSRDLQEIVRASAEFQASLANEQLISFSTGEGIALVFFRDPVAPAQCALEVARAVKAQESIKLRMGLHTGPVYRVADINLNHNVSGGAVAVAQQVAACGASGHILLSQPVAEFLKQLENWRANVHDVGDKRTKHGRLHLYNLHTGDLGNSGNIGKKPSKRLSGKKAKETALAHTAVHESPYVQLQDRTDQDATLAGGGRAPRVNQALVAQILGVSHRRDDKGKEGLIYAQVPLAMEDVASDPVFVPIKAQVLETHIQEVRRRVEDLTRRALVGQRRGSIGIEAAADNLARQVMPPMGFGGLMGDGIHPQFDLIQDAASAIPWEVLEESYFGCPRCRSRSLPDFLRQSTQPHCSACGGAMNRIGGKLALRYHLTHLVRGPGRSASAGKKFLFIEDPTGDLCDASKDPDAVCGDHLEQLHDLIKDQGFTIDLLRKSHASVQHVLRALSDAELIGIYYFGHGFFPRDGDEGRLILSDGVLFASQIEDVAPTAKIVFLNACEGAATGRDWDLEKRSRSVAHAFARGGRGKVVIAPLWPVVNVQAAESALAFFRYASSATPMAESLANARRQSLQRYESGEPHLAWMAYRYFGDPNNTFPAPIEKSVLVASGALTPRSSRVFDGKGQLDTEAFSFGVEEVLVRAAKRRNSQGRAQLTTNDLIAGLIRKGDLTRMVFRRVAVDPDELYETIAETIEEGPRSAAEREPSRSGPESKDESTLLQSLSKWIVRDKAEFSTQLVEVLEEADLAAKQRQPEKDDVRISEHQILHSLLVGGEWRPAITIQLPPAANVRAALSECQKSGSIDDNGAISLKALDRDARKIIEGAHELSQQRGVFPISHRLMLAAFLADAKGHAARVCKCADIDPELLFLLMIASTEKSDEERSPKSFGLSTEACERIVLPVIEQAVRTITAPELISQVHLFRAFCEKATPEFRAWLQDPPLPVDLAALRDTDPNREELLRCLDTTARKVVDTAHALAQESGVHPIPNRLLLAAFLIDPRAHAATVLQSHNVPAAGLCAALIQGARSGPARSFPLDASACDRAVMPMIHRSREIADDSAIVTEKVLFEAFCDTAPPDLKNSLKRSPMNIDLDVLAKGAGRSASGNGAPSIATPDDDDLAVTKMGLSQAQFDGFAWRVLVRSTRIARVHGWAEVRTPHLLVALLESSSGVAAALLRASPMPLEDVKQLVLSLVPPRSSVADSVSISFGNNVRDTLERARQVAKREKREQVNENDLVASLLADSGGVVAQLFGNLGLVLPNADESGDLIVRTSGGGSSLSRLGNDLTEKARRGELPDVVGRDTEIETALQALLLTENANPLLVGDAGVGKTAIVEGIAQRIASGRCPLKLRSMRVIELSAGSLVANTRLRGEFEQRVQEVLAEARENVILFIDEIHTIVGAGSAEGSGPDASNMLKTALARGEIRLIGATTHVEFKRTVARDKALSRRFQVQLINPPSREATLRVLSARQPVLEQHHGVSITEEAKDAAVDLSGRYILDRQWPAKARDVLDRACVLAVAEQTTHGPVRVTREHIAKVVCNQTGIPLDRVSSNDLAALVSLEERLAQRIIGQQNAVRTVASAVRRGRQGLAGPNRPWGIFLFLGPPGVGKTELAKILAEEVYGGSEGLIRFDMGDFTEPHSTARLIGAPPGYIGYDQGSPLAERLRRQPYSLLLFDEVEHAHENVLAVLLRLFSEGTLTDHEGNVADGRNTVVIMTSNLLGLGHEVKQIGFGMGHEPAGQSSQTDLRALLERHFHPKLIDRLDAVVRFNPLGVRDLEAIARRKVAEVVTRLTSLYTISIGVRDEVFSWLAQKAADGGHGARHLQRTIDDHLGPVLIAAVSNLGGTIGCRLEVAVLAAGDGVECLLQRARPG